MTNNQRSTLFLALQLALLSGMHPQARAEAFPPRLDLSTLDGSNGVAFVGSEEDGLSGFAVSAGGDINGDGIADLMIGAYRFDTSLGGIDSGVSYIVYGSDHPFPGVVSLGDFSGPVRFDGFGGESAQGVRFSGYSVSAAGDFNDDGFDDFLIGAPGNLIGIPFTSTTGRVYLGFGRAPFVGNIFLGSFTGSTGFKVNAEDSLHTSLGYSVGAAGDFNGDGIDDVLIGATRADLDGGRGGRSYILFGSSSLPNPFTFELDTLNGSNGVVIEKEPSSDRLGASVTTIGDFNGDGLDDVVIGAPGSTSNGLDSGTSYLLFGTTAPVSPIELSSLDGTHGFALWGERNGNQSGRTVHAAGDINGDGFDDVLIGAPYGGPMSNGAGSSYLIFGTDQTVVSPLSLATLNGTNGLFIDGAAANDFAGMSVSGGHDLNGDGFDDLVIGAVGADSLDADGDLNATDTGVVHVVFGAPSLPNPIQLATLDGTNGFTINGETRLDRLGKSVDFVGDVNGDGTADLLIGAYGSDRGGEESGTSYLVFGRTLNDLAISLSNGTGSLQPGQTTSWVIEASSLGPYAIHDALVSVSVPFEISNASWTCSGEGGAVCPNASGTDGINELVDFPGGGRLIYTLTGTVNADEPSSVSTTASVFLPFGVRDIDPANNNATDRDPIGLFADGFESDV